MSEPRRLSTGSDAAMDMDAAERLLNQGDPVVAVVGATNNCQKYGSRIYRNLKAKGVRVYPVNATSHTVDGDRAYATLTDLPEPPEIVNFVIPPKRTLGVLERIDGDHIGLIWLQPGAGDEAVRAYLEEHDIGYVDRECIMVCALPRVGRT